MFRKTNKSAHLQAGGGAAPSIIARDLRILGNLASDGVVDFAGTIDGNVQCKILTVRPQGVVNGEIAADTAHIYGKVRGVIRAKQVHLYATSHIEGIVMHESLAIEDGAFIDGKCKRTDKPMQEPAQETPPMPFFTAEDEAAPAIDLKPLKNIRLIS